MTSSSSTTIRRGRESFWQTVIYTVYPNGLTGLIVALQLVWLFFKQVVLTCIYTYCICLPGLTARISRSTRVSVFFKKSIPNPNPNPNCNPNPIPNVQQFHEARLSCAPIQF